MKICNPFFAISLGIFSVLAPTAPAAAPAPIQAVLGAQAVAWNRGDIDGFMSGYARSPKTTFISGDEVTLGWQTVRDRCSMSG
ncbi:MAG: hypothetical protein ABI233_11560 [Chthoniobacterales bacterium]